MLVGLIAPTSGTAKVCGYDVQTEPIEVRKRLAYVPIFRSCMTSLRRGNFFASPASSFT